MKSFPTFRPLAALAALLALALPSPAANRQEMVFSFSFKEGAVTYAPQPDGTLLPVLEGAELPVGNPGKPWLAVKDEAVKLPIGWKAIAVDATAERRLIREGIDVTPEQAPHPTNEENPGWTPKDPVAYASDEPWPAEAAELTGSHVLRGFPFATVRLKPLSYVASERKLFLAESIKVVVTIEEEEEPGALGGGAKGGAGAAAAPFRPGDPSGRFQERLNGMVVNPFREADALTQASAKAKAGKTSEGNDEGEPEAKAGSCTYLLITGEALAPAFQRLVDFRKKFNGVTAELVTVETIDATYDGTRPSGGTDIQTKIRNCIKAYVQDRGTEYVCLGGDDTVVPDRDCYVYGTTATGSYDDMPTDLYYSGLDGTWDANADGVYGKASGDDCDLAPDVVVCRIPVQTVQHAANYVKKLVAYEQNVADNVDTLSKFYLGGEMAWEYAWATNNLWPRETEIPTFNDGLSSYAGRTTRASDCEVWGRRLWRDKFSKEEYGFKPTFFYDTITSWDTSVEGDYLQNEANVVKRMSENGGHHFLYYDTHGNTGIWSLESGYFSTSGASDLTGPVDFVYTCACLSGHFDKCDPSLSEAMVRNPNGGTIGWLGCSREGWGNKMSYSAGSPTDYGGSQNSPAYGIAFYDQILVEGVRYFGDAVCWGKAARISSCSSDNTCRWLMFGLNGQGDPLASLYQPHLVAAPAVETPTVTLSGSTASLSALLPSIGGIAEFADVWFEVSYDDLEFSSPVLVAAGRLRGAGTATATVTGVPSGTGTVYVRAHALSNLGRETVSGIGSNAGAADALPAALDAPTRTFPNASSVPWTVEADSTATGGFCARSGKITHNQSTEFTTVVTGPAKVAFRWKVSSEANYDKLTFYVGSTTMGTISGEQGWTRVVYDVPSGEQTLKWEYKKDSSADRGSDAAWVDAFSFPAADETSLPAARVERVGTVSADGKGTVRATATSLGGASSGTLSLEYGTSILFAGATSVSLGTVSEGGSVSKTLTGLAAGTTYYVRAKLVAGGRTVYSSNVTCLVVPGAEAGMCTLSGTVLAGNGRPAEGLDVLASPGDHSAAVGADGSYSIKLPHGWSGTVSVSGAAATPAAAQISVGTASSKTQDFAVDHVLRVRAGATGAGDGSSWADAYPSLQEAIGKCSVETFFGSGNSWREIWVAAGTYSPGASQSSTFDTPKGLEVYGGFSGTETERSQRDWIRNRTILSGERGDPTDPYDNVKSIIRGPSENGEALWDGFVISGASQSAVAAGSDISGYRESAFLVLDHCLLTGNASTNCQPVALYGYTRVRNSVITGNTQSFSSYDSASSCIARWCELDNCTVFGNAASYTVLHECTMHNTVVWGNTYGKSNDAFWYSYTSLSSDWPLEGYGSDRWLAKNPQRTIGTTYKNTDPGFVTDEATGLACALDSDSYAVDKGRAISWMTDDSLDYLGNPRCYGDAPDLGAIEWFVPGPTAPEFQSVEIGTPDYDRISVETILKTLGNQSSYVTLEAQVSTSSSFGTVAARERVRATAKKTPFSATVTGLDDNTAYYLRVVATGENGLTATSATFAFTTPNLALPAFTVALSSESPTRGTVALSIRTLGSGANSASVSVTYSTSSDFSGAKTVSLGTAAAAGAFSGELTRLSQGTTYYVKVTLANNRGETATVNAGSFTTQRAGGYVPGLMQAKTTCANKSYPDFSFRASDDPNAEPAPGPFMADITGSGSPSAVNAFTGKTWAWANNTTYYYEGEMFFKGGVTYNFFHSIDDGAAIELDGEMFTKQSAADESGYNVAATFASKSYDSDGWHAIRIWVYDWSGGKGYVSGKVGFNGVGIGWNTNGCTAVGSANQSRWSTLRDPGDASFFRTLSGAALPSYVTLDDDLAIAGTTLTGTIRTEAVEDGCTVTLYAGQTDGGSNATAWAQSFVVGTVPTETYDLSFQWEDFCAAGDCDGWFVVARMTNATGTYEGWSVVRTPSVSGAFLVGIRDDGSAGLTTLKVSPRVVDFGDFPKSATMSIEWSTDAEFASPSSKAAGTATTTNWLSSVTLSGLSPATVYYVRAKGVDGTETAYSRKLQLSTLDYGAPVVSLSVGTPTLTTLPVSWTLSGLGLGNDSVELFLDWGTSASYGSTVSLGTFSAAASGSRTLEGLSPETAYHVRLRAVASPSHKEAATADRTGTTVAVGNPSVSAALVGDSTQFAQSFSWSLASLGTGASSATVYYDLSTSSDFSSGTRTVTLGSGLRAAAGATVDLSDLASETAYWLRVRAVNDARKEAVSSVLAFTTKPVGTPAVALSIDGITQRAATATIVVSSLGDAARSATIVLEWGTSTAYGSSVTVASGVTERGTFTQQIAGLEPETAYFARVRVVNDANKTGSATAAFETLEPANPVFTHAVSPSYTSAGVSVQIEKLGNGASSAAGFVRWFSDAALSNPAGTVALPAAYAPGAVSATMTGLGTATKYWYEVVVTNNLAGIAAQTNSFTTAAAGNVEIGTGYYEPGLIMGYRSEQWPNYTPAQMEAMTYAASTATRALGAISAYARKPAACVNELDSKSYSMSSGGIFTYDGEMFMEAGVEYRFASEFFKQLVVVVDGTPVIEQPENNGGYQNIGVYTPDSTGWHAIRVVTLGDNNGNGYCGGGTTWANTSSPFYAAGIGLAWTTNANVTSVGNGNVGSWKRVMDAGDRHLLRARGVQPTMAFLDAEPVWTTGAVDVPVRVDATMDGATLRVYLSRRSDAWYFEDRWEQVGTVANVPSGASVQTVHFTGVDTTVDWYVSARLTSGAYDLWTDPVKFTPTLVRRPPAFTASLGDPGFTTVPVSIRVTSLGDDASNVSLYLDVRAGGSVRRLAVAEQVSSWNRSWTTPEGTLEPGTSYSARVVAVNDQGVSSEGAWMPFRTASYTPPELGEISVGSVTRRGASADVRVESLGAGSTSARLVFELSASASFSPVLVTATNTATGLAVYPFGAEGLDAGTTYYVRVTAFGSNGLVSEPATASFATLAANPPAATVEVSDVSFSSAVATVVVTDFGDDADSAAITLQYATSADFSEGLVELSGSALQVLGSMPYTLADLAPGTAYWVRAVVSGETAGEPAGEPTGYVTVTEAVSFTTPAYGAPVVGSATVSGVSRDGASVDLALDSLGAGSSSATVLVEASVGQSFSPVAATASGTVNASGSSSWRLSGLAAGTTYRVRVTITGSNGLSTVLDNLSFTTGTASPPAGVVTVSDKDFTSAKATVSVTSFGDAAPPVRVVLEWSADSSFSSPRTVDLGTLSATGTKETVLSSLEPGGTYWVRAVLSGTPADLVGATPAVSFSTTSYTAPTLGSVTATALSMTTARVTVPVSALGRGSASATVLVEVSSDGFATVAASATKTVSAAGTVSLDLSGLVRETSYRVRVVATGSNGLSAQSPSAVFTTPGFPLELGPATYSLDAAATEATLRVPLLKLVAPPATVALTFAGTVVKTWTGVAEAGEFSFAVPVLPGEVYAFSFSATAGSETVTSSGRVEARATVRWFDVDWKTDGYASGPDWNAPAAAANARGAWTRPAGDDSSLAAGALAYSLDAGSALLFRPTEPCATNADVVVEGRTTVQLSEDPAAPPAGTVAGLVFLESGIRGWAGGAWHELTGAWADAGQTVDWKIEAFLPKRGEKSVRFTVDGAVLRDAATGSDLVPLASTALVVSRVAFTGGGAIGDFSGVYKAPVVVARFDPPEYGDGSPGGGAAIGFAADPDTGDPLFRVTIDNASPDAWYAPYAANSVTGRYVRVGEPRNPGSGPVQAFDIPADGDAEFVVVVAADDPALLVEFLDQIQGLDD